MYNVVREKAVVPYLNHNIFDTQTQYGYLESQNMNSRNIVGSLEEYWKVEKEVTSIKQSLKRESTKPKSLFQSKLKQIKPQLWLAGKLNKPKSPTISVTKNTMQTQSKQEVLNYVNKIRSRSEQNEKTQTNFMKNLNQDVYLRMTREQRILEQHELIMSQRDTITQSLAYRIGRDQQDTLLQRSSRYRDRVEWNMELEDASEVDSRCWYKSLRNNNIQSDRHGKNHFGIQNTMMPDIYSDFKTNTLLIKPQKTIIINANTTSNELYSQKTRIRYMNRLKHPYPQNKQPLFISMVKINLIWKHQPQPLIWILNDMQFTNKTLDRMMVILNVTGI